MPVTEPLKPKGSDPDAPEPLPADAAVYLARAVPFRVLREIDPALRSDWRWVKNNYVVHWNKPGTRVAVVQMLKRSSRLALCELTDKGWRQVTLPDLHEFQEFDRIVREQPDVRPSNVMKAFIESVSFRKDGILLGIDGYVYSDPGLDVHVTYRLRADGPRWVATVVERKAKKMR